MLNRFERIHNRL